MRKLLLAVATVVAAGTMSSQGEAQEQRSPAGAGSQIVYADLQVDSADWRVEPVRRWRYRPPRTSYYYAPYNYGYPRGYYNGYARPYVRPYVRPYYRSYRPYYSYPGVYGYPGSYGYYRGPGVYFGFGF